MDRAVTVRFSLRSVVAVLALLTTLALALKIPDLLIEGFLALVLASALLPGVRALEKRWHWPRVAATGFLVAAVVATLTLLAALVVPPFLDQASVIAATLPHIAETWSGWYQHLRGEGANWSWLPALTNLPARIGADAGQLLGEGLAWGRRAAEAFAALAVVLVLAFFLLLDGPQLRRGLLDLVPARYRALVDAQIEPIALKLGRYVQGTLLSMAFFIVFQATVLSLVGLPLALGVAILAGVLEVIPMLGTVVGILLSVGIAATVSWHMVLVVLVVFAVGRVLQDNVINPYVFSHSLKLPPSLVIVSLLVGAKLMGIVGALVAVPLLAAVQVLVQNLYVAPMRAGEHSVPPEADQEAAATLRVSFLSGTLASGQEARPENRAPRS